ncbi:mandelate racemase/muconate lactonizing enzyme family protein [Herbidospora sp. NEAU-GS84]|uniref:Mandelate racemase/muconate lactonizing enzyme family protein n=1 Tax=Herbidospora solisilvae TaxID=2696284 RepID=A0A7C9J307_9ACTN|nr:mandelate racemase/muconate lactonizing enzyme family protein [Herbidospora solisilvae]NAS23222.1 mandelate racemase/muconate lactonizing enzyme family protein [Herbidospora solisilvae]
MTRIAGLHTLPLRADLPRPWGPDVPYNHVIACTLVLDDGRTGTGFSWTPSIGAAAVTALLDHDIAAFVKGLPPHPEVVWDHLWRHLREAGGGGVTTIAMAAVDIALWDLRASGQGLGLADTIGRRRDTVPVYASGVNRHYPLGELVEQARRWIGYPAVKIKVGRDDDVERVAAVREVLGPGTSLMVDANQRWDLFRARAMIRELEPFGLTWVEEPLPADDLHGLRRLRESVDVPIAAGESLYTVHEFRALLEAVDVVQPNVVRVGGVTPLLRIAELARVHGVPTFPHLLPDLSAQLALALPLPCMVEDVEDASLAALGLLDGPPPVELGPGGARVGTHSGHGLRFVSRQIPSALEGRS